MGIFSFVGALFGFGPSPDRTIKISKSAAASGLQIIYGTRRVEPTTVFKVASRNNMHTTGAGYDDFVAPQSTKNEEYRKRRDWLHRVDVWGQGPIQGIDRFWVDGDVSSATRFSKRPYFRAASYFGRDPQPAAAELVAGHSEWNSTHRGHGVAYSWTRFYNSKNKPEYTSEPEVNALVKGLRLYDPRIGSHNPTDPDTWTYSNNRALVVLNYMMSAHGLNAAVHELDMDSFAAAADICDEPITVPARPSNTSGVTITDYFDWREGNFREVDAGDYFPGHREEQVGTSQARYEADAVLDPKRSVVENIKKLLEGMGWALAWSNGKHRLVIEAPVQSPVMTFDEDSILGGWTVERGRRSTRYNRITIDFPNRNRDYEQDSVSWPTLYGATHQAMIDEDSGQELHTNRSVDTITDFYAAQAYAEYLVRKSRVDVKITGLRLSPKALLLEPGDVIAISYPEKNFQNTLFIVERVSISSMLDVSVDLLLYDPSVYGEPELSDEPVPGSPYDPSIWQDAEPVGNLQLAALYSENADGSVINSIRASWVEPNGLDDITAYEVRWKEASAAEFENSVFLTANSASTRIDGLASNTNYTVEVRYTNRRGKTSDPASQTLLLEGIASKLDSIEEGATRTVPRGEYDDAATYSYGDVVQYGGSSYIFSDPVAATSGVEPDSSPYWSLLAASGGYFDVRFRRAASQPATPAGSNPAGWEDGPPEANGNPLWMTTAYRNGSGDLQGGWSQPQEVGGSGLEVEYSANGSSGWHSPPFNDGVDLYMRQRLAGGSWSDPIRIVGEDGAAGADGNTTYVGHVGYKPSIGAQDWPAGIGFYGYKNGVPDKDTPAKLVLSDGTEFSFGDPHSNEDSRAYSNTIMSGVSECYVVLDTSGSRRFTHSSGQGNSRLAIAYKYNDGSWKYQKRGVGWVNWPSSDLQNYMVIGTARKKSSGSYPWEAFTPVQMTMNAAPEIGAVRTSDTEHIIENAVTELFADEGDDTNVIGSSWVTAASVNVTGNSGDEVLVIASGTFVDNSMDSQDYVDGWIRVQRAGSTLQGENRIAAGDADDGGKYANSFINQIPTILTSSSQEFQLQVRELGTANPNVQDPVITVLKRLR